jgi:hypothetical protein
MAFLDDIKKPITAAQQAAADAKAAVQSAAPSFDSMIAAAKSGAIFKDVQAQLSSIATLPGIDVSSAIAVATKAQASLTADVAIASAAVEAKIKQAFAAGTTLSAAEISSTTSMLDAAKNMGSVVSGALNSAKDAVSSVAGTFGAAIPGDAKAAVSSISAAVGSFVSSIPTDPVAKAAFDAIPGNLEKAAAATGLTSAASGIASSLNSSMASLAASSAAAKSDAISLLKANVQLAQLSKPQLPAAEAALGAAIDKSKVDTYNITKAQEQTVVPDLPDVAKPEIDKIRPGRASILEESPTLAEKPDNVKRIWTYELKALSDELEKAKLTYYSAFGANQKMSKEQQTPLIRAYVDSALRRLIGEEAVSRAQQRREITKAKPNKDLRSAEEQAIVDASNADLAIADRDPDFIRVSKTNFDTMKTLEAQYKELHDNWTSVDNRNSLSAALLEKISAYKS